MVAFVGMSWSKQIFDSVFAGLILFQVYHLSADLVHLSWNYIMTKNRTRRLRFQQFILPHYNTIKTLLVIAYTIEVGILLATGLKYIFLILFAYIALGPVISGINDIESRVEKIIMDADTFEDIEFLSSRMKTFTTTSSMMGMAASTALLMVFSISMLPL